MVSLGQRWAALTTQAPGMWPGGPKGGRKPFWGEASQQHLGDLRTSEPRQPPLPESSNHLGTRAPILRTYSSGVFVKPPHLRCEPCGGSEGHPSPQGPSSLLGYRPCAQRRTAAVCTRGALSPVSQRDATREVHPPPSGGCHSFGRAESRALLS